MTVHAPGVPNPHRAMLAIGLIACAFLVVVVAGLLPGHPASAQVGSTAAPGMICTYTSQDDFPLNDPQITGDLAQVSVGPEPYTSGYYPTPRNGVRIRDFRDPLRIGERTGNTYDDVWSVDNSPADGLTVIATADGARLGGTSQFNGGSPHVNHAALWHALPQSQNNPSTAYFQATWKLRLDSVAGQAGVEDGNTNYQISGLRSTPGHVGHPSYFGAGTGGSELRPRLKFVDEYGDPFLVWDVFWQATVTQQQWHGWKVLLSTRGVYAEYDQQPMNIGNANFQNNMSVLNNVGLVLSERWRHMTLVATYADFEMNWLNAGVVTSIGIPLPAGTTRYGTFDAQHEIDNGAISYFVIDATNRRVQVSPGDDLGAIAPPLVAPIRLEADLTRPSFDDASPLLVQWKVQTCLPATPTPTTTSTPRTPTPTNTPIPTRTPRPTSTPGAFFEVAPLKPAVHLKADPVLAPPAPPDDQTDWRESDAIWYPLQVYAGLVPFAYADPARPPQLCYWTATGWTCKNGTISLKAYTLRDIQMNGMSYLDAPITVGYARAHELMKWRQPQYRFDANEYTWVNWLAPGGVTPTCASGQRCVNVEGASAGVSFIVFDVIGVIHWDAIPGVGGPYEYAFTNNNYRVPISLVYPRAEP